MRSLIVVLATVLAQNWPQLLGPERNGHYTDTDVSASAPTLVWERDVGQGFSGPVIASGRLILFHRVGRTERVEALEVRSGKPIWSFEYDTAYRDDFGFDEGPRATPVVAEGSVFTHGAQGVLHALELETGRKRWRVDTMERFGVRKGWFGVATSPLVAKGHVLVNVGGADGAGIVAFDAATGDVVWKATNDEASYSTPTLVGSDAVFLTREGLVVLDVETGAIRHQERWRSRSRASVNAATPLIVGDVVFVTASYGTGAAAWKRSGGEFEELWASDDALSSHYATAVQSNGVLYGFHGRQEYGPALRAVDLKTGAVRWSEERFMAGTITLAGDLLVILRESGELVLAEATPEGYRPLLREPLLPGAVRSYPALADGLLCARSETTLACFALAD